MVGFEGVSCNKQFLELIGLSVGNLDLGYESINKIFNSVSISDYQSVWGTTSVTKKPFHLEIEGIDPPVSRYGPVVVTNSKTGEEHQFYDYVWREIYLENNIMYNVNYHVYVN